VGFDGSRDELAAALARAASSMAHRGPDDAGLWTAPEGGVGLAHRRLSILDLSALGCQPMWDAAEELAIVLNGEIYNYIELRSELSEYPFRTQTDTEVILAAWRRWGEACLDRFVGMFALALWDVRSKTLFAARDRFGVKPFFYCPLGDGIVFGSEIKALHEVGVPREPDPVTWATYLKLGAYDHSERTFWKGIRSLPAGHWLRWRGGRATTGRWYDLSLRGGDDRAWTPVLDVQDQYRALLEESVRMRFRADVPVGINLSGGLDSSLLLGLVQSIQGPESDIKAFTFTTGDPAYDELPWVRQMLEKTHHPLVECRLAPEEVPGLVKDVASCQDEPFGGLPTLAYAKLFREARKHGVIVLLDGQGMDEQWAGYDYYQNADANGQTALLQGAADRPVRPECLAPEFAALAQERDFPRPYPDRLRNLQYRDVFFTKIPRALRFNDRISMLSSTELREPFLDHRLFEVAFRQPEELKIRGGISKWLLRQLAQELVPAGVVQAPKRPMQTPQREWLRGPLREWAGEGIETALRRHVDWFDVAGVQANWKRFLAGESDNSFYVWQWLSSAWVTSAGDEVGSGES
jgi:asparagine synthase (glutamine-hydrolysing)